MSSVRMCDRCGTVFSERAENWSAYTGTKMARDDKGKLEQHSESLDACPDCTELMTSPQRPELTTHVSDVRQPTVSPHYEPDSG
jgi:hypothetical protein